MDPTLPSGLSAWRTPERSRAGCVAGKRMSDQSWFRPISDRQGHEISELDRRYPDGKTAQLLDVIAIPCIEARPYGHQSENVLIDDRFYWEKKGRAPVALPEILAVGATIEDQEEWGS